MNDKVRDLEVNDDELAGLYGHNLNEGPFIPKYKEAGSEKIIEGNNNSFIVLGRDRDGHGGEGLGGLGGTGCGSIDLVAGLGGFDYREYVKKLLKTGTFNKETFPPDLRLKDPMFFKDAARIYITEKGDIDTYFGLAQGSERIMEGFYKSAVGIKADHVRLVGREHIKIVTGKGRLENGGTAGERNSSGGEIMTVGKIDFIAGNYTDYEENPMITIFGSLQEDRQTIKKLQPIVKGDNLVDLLGKIIENINDLSQMATNNTDWIQNLSEVFGSHHHESNVPFGPSSTPIISGIRTIPIWVECWENFIMGLILSFQTFVNRVIYLWPFFSTYINSRFVNTT